MPRDEDAGLIRAILVVVLALLVILLVSQVARIVFGNSLAEIAITLVLIIAILWLLTREGKDKIRRLLDDAGL